MSTTTIHTPSSRCEFGIAWTDITPPVGMYHRMWGAAAHDRSTGIHRPLRATVAIMRPLDRSRQTVLVSLDHCLLRAPEMEALLSETCRLTGLSRLELLVTFSHTHSAGYLSRDRTDFPGGDLIAPYLDSLPSKINEAFQAAKANTQPATLTYGSTACEMGCHRDYFDEARGHYVCGFNPDAAEPLPLNVVRVTQSSPHVPREDSRSGNGTGESNNANRALGSFVTQSVTATIVNYPCHTTTLAWENTLVSPDYVGALREVVERETNSPCLFLLAPCGDIGPRDGYVGDTSIADRNGRQVGFAALSVLAGMNPVETDHVYQGPVFSGATLGNWRHQPWTAERFASTAVTKQAAMTVPLPYLPSLPKLPAAEQLHRELIAEERTAREAGRSEESATLRAKVERQRRLLDRIRPLPQGDNYPMPAWAWQWGDAFWIAVEGEPYHFLQSELTRQFPHRPLIAITLANGTNVSYLPTREAYSKPQLYQPEVALVAPGGLETLTDALSRQLSEWDG